MAEKKQPGAEAAARRGNLFVNVLLQVLLAVAVLVMVNYLAMRHYHQFDWTRDRVYTLSEQTNNVLRSLPRQVELIVMMSQADPLFGATQRMLDKYIEEAGSKLEVRYVDPDQNPTEFEHLLEQYPIAAGVTQDEQIVVEQVIVVTAGETNRFVTPPEDFVSNDARGMMEFGAPSTFNPPRAELAMTSAIYRVVAERQRTICLTSGHGEWQAAGVGDRTLSGLGDYLERYEVQMRSVAVSTNRPPDFDSCDAVVVAGPRRPFMPDEARLLQQYVEEGGGDLVLLLDPLVERERFVPTGLEALTRRFGVEIENNEVSDPRSTAQFCGGGHSSAFIAASQERYICVVRARSVSAVEGRESITFLETRSDEAFGEVNASQLSDPERDDDDHEGPLVLGLAVEQGNEAARTARIERQRAEVEAELPEGDRRGSLVIVMGDSDFLNQTHFQNPQLGNFSLTAGLFNSVADNTVLVAQPPREVEQAQMTLTDEQLGRAQLIFIFVLPLIGAAAGLSIWLTRRR